MLYDTKGVAAWLSASAQIGIFGCASGSSTPEEGDSDASVDSDADGDEEGDGDGEADGTGDGDGGGAESESEAAREGGEGDGEGDGEADGDGEGDGETDGDTGTDPSLFKHPGIYLSETELDAMRAAVNSPDESRVKQAHALFATTKSFTEPKQIYESLDYVPHPVPGLMGFQ